MILNEILKNQDIKNEIVFIELFSNSIVCYNSRY